MNDEHSQPDPDVHTVELTDDEGNPVVISQQNVGPGSMVGQGEFPDPDSPPEDPGTAADEQRSLQRERPV